MLRTPSAIEGQGGAISEDKARERNRMLQVRDQMAQLAAENGLKVSDAIAGQLLPTLKARDSQPEGYEAGLRRSQPQLGTIVKGIVDSDERVVSDLLPTPALGHIRNYDEPVEDYLARRQKMQDGEYKGMPGVSLGVAVRMEMLPTPNTMEHREIKTPEQIATLKEKSPGGYRNLRESVINDLLPTPIVGDYKDGSAAQERDGKISTDTVARAVFNSGEVTDISWGKFEPAIRRWEEVLGRPAPEPTKPDGKDGSHRLSSRFTEWMMGLPDGWITDVGLNRVDELKACGNGVVPQQAELALRILLQGIDYEPANNDVNLPTPTVSDVYTSSLTSSQQKEGSMHSVTLPQAVRGLANG